MGAPTRREDQYIFFPINNCSIHIFLNPVPKAEVEVLGVYAGLQRPTLPALLVATSRLNTSSKLQISNRTSQQHRQSYCTTRQS